MLARLAPIAILMAACSDPAELPESMRLTGVAGTAMVNDAACGFLVGVPPNAPFSMNVRDHSDPATCTCYSESGMTGRSPCSFDGDRMTCPANDNLTVWVAVFDPEAMTADVSVTRGTCSGSVSATVAELTAN